MARLKDKYRITEYRARQLCEEVRQGIRQTVAPLIELKQTNAWMLINSPDGKPYRTWGTFVEGEFGHSKQWADEQIRLGSMQQRILPSREDGQESETAVSKNTPSSQTLEGNYRQTPLISPRIARELAKVPEEQQAALFEEAAEMADGPPTAADVARVREKHFSDDDGEEDILEADSEPIKDQLGNVVPPELWDVFSAVDEFKEIVSLIRRAKHRCRKLQMKPEAAIYFDTEAAFKRLSAAEHAAKLAMPYSIHEPCEGSGCRDCGGNGWLLKTELAGPEATPNQRKLLENRGIDTAGMLKAEASRRIDDIAVKEGWPPRPRQRKDIASDDF